MAKHGDERTGNLVCSFCGKSQDEVRKLIAGPTVYICDECIDLCNDIMAEECDQEEGLTSTSAVPKPAEMVQLLLVEQGRPGNSFGYPSIGALARRTDIFTGVCGFSSGAFNVAAPGVERERFMPGPGKGECLAGDAGRAGDHS